MVNATLPLAPGASGEAVRDLQRRLSVAGHDCGADPAGRYDVATEAAVRTFQERRGLRTDGICGEQTWSSLVEASWHLGDRMLYLRDPMLRGDDVADLQRALGALGFDAGRVDGIHGPRTAGAVLEFQRNMGLTNDGICGPATVDTLRRVASRDETGAIVALLREAEALRTAPPRLAGRRVAVAESGGLGALVDALGRALSEVGAIVDVVHHPDDREQAAAANGFAAELFVAVGLREDPGVAASYFATDGFESVGGRSLAECILAALAEHLPHADSAPRGMRLPVLRETRMPAVVVELGPPAAVVAGTAALVGDLTRAIELWAGAAG